LGTVSLKLANPRDFYHQCHRPAHFLNFASIEDTVAESTDREDHFA